MFVFQQNSFEKTQCTKVFETTQNNEIVPLKNNTVDTHFTSSVKPQSKTMERSFVSSSSSFIFGNKFFYGGFHFYNFSRRFSKLSRFLNLKSISFVNQPNHFKMVLFTIKTISPFSVLLLEKAMSSSMVPCLVSSNF